MKQCKGCIYWDDMRQYLGNWINMMGQPHPCLECKHFPKIRDIHPSFYVNKGVEDIE